MAIVGLTADGKKIVVTEVTSAITYNSTTGFVVTVPELEKVHAVLYASIDGGYKVNTCSISGNTVSLFLHYYNYAQETSVDGPSIDIPNNTNIGTRTVTLVTLGV